MWSSDEFHKKIINKKYLYSGNNYSPLKISNLNNEIESNFKEREYKERLGLRKKHNLPNNNNILKLL